MALIARLEALSAREAMKRTPTPQRDLGAVVPDARADRNDGVTWAATWFLLHGLAKVSVIFALKGRDAQLAHRNFAIGYIATAALALLLVQALLLAPHSENVSYSEFKALLKQGKVGDLVLDKQTISGGIAVDGLEKLLPRERIEALRRGGGPHRFVTTRVDDPSLIAELEAASVKFTGRAENTRLSTLLSWTVPTLLFVGVWMVVMRPMRVRAWQDVCSNEQRQSRR